MLYDRGSKWDIVNVNIITVEWKCMQKNTSDDINTQVGDDLTRVTTHDKGTVADETIKSKPVKLQRRPLSKKKRWSIILAILLVIIIIGFVPFTRYKILGLFIKESLSITVVDSATHIPVVGAIVHINNMTATTNASGQVKVTVPVGDTTASISKQYYKSAASSTLVTLTASQNKLNLSLVATGRQVPVVIINKINNQPVADATIKVLDTTAETDKSGKATIVLPTTATTQQATISASHYNTLTVPVTVTSQVIATNTVAMVPAGKVYFLSNLSGKIDVISTNLDGSSRTTVVAGTGNETADSTSLLAAKDWKYLALLSKRDTSTTQSKIYLVTASTNALSVIDEGANVSFGSIGWDGDNFVYTVDRQKAINGTYDQTALKSFNAITGHITTIDQTDTPTYNLNAAVTDTIQTTLLSDGILYTKFWSVNGQYANPIADLAGKSQIIVKTKPDGSGAKTLKTINATDYQSIGAQVGKPDEVYYQVGGIVDYNTQKPSIYLKYTNGSVQSTTDVTDTTFYSNSYVTYLVSPSGNNTFWSIPTDGKNALFVGDRSGGSATPIAKLSDYAAYGWYGDSYLLASKNGSELYIVPVNGGNGIKISDYLQSAQYYDGYGRGYGNL